MPREIEVGMPYEAPTLLEVGMPYSPDPALEIGEPEFGAAPRRMAKGKGRAPGPETRVVPAAGQGPRTMPRGGPQTVAPPEGQPWWQDEGQADAVVASLMSKLETTESPAPAGPGVLPWDALPEEFRTKAAASVQGSPVGWRGFTKMEPRERELLTRLVKAGAEERRAREEAAARQVMAGGPAGMAGAEPVR